MTLAEMAPGMLLTWLYVPRGGYAYVTPVDAEVVRSVEPDSLRPRKATP